MNDIKTLKLDANSNRKAIVQMVYEAGVGHVGGALSIIDILTAIYALDVDFNTHPRSRVILSKGHAVPAQYAILAQKGIIKASELSTFRKINSRLQGHPYTGTLPEVDATTGLLGQGFSLAIGHALGKRAGKEKTRVYAIAGDGEMHEGQMWEALMFASHHKLNNLIFIIDYNTLSSSGPTNDVINLEPLVDKIEAFNIHTLEINGHDMDEIVETLRAVREPKDTPSCIIAHTIKGKGVSFMESNPKWHSSGLTEWEYQRAMDELNHERSEIDR